MQESVFICRKYGCLNLSFTEMVAAMRKDTLGNSSLVSTADIKTVLGLTH